jgi:hypothetical protein
VIDYFERRILSSFKKLANNTSEILQEFKEIAGNKIQYNFYIAARRDGRYVHVTLR